MVKSRLVWVLAAVVAAQLALMLRRYLPADLAALLSDELVGAVGAALGLGAVGLRVQDRRKIVTAAQLLDRRAAKAAAKLSALLMLGGCSIVSRCITPEPLRCDVRARIECSHEPATGIQVCSVYCTDKLLWRQNCDGAIVRRGKLFCNDVPALELPGSISEVAP